jgi:lysyl-tRNA synthetase class 2
MRRTAGRRDGSYPVSSASPWWAPDVHADRRPFLLARNRVQAAWRGFFAARSFIEVETPILQVSPGNETHLHAFGTDWIAPDGSSARLYLHTSPEFACKKLLAAGETQICTFARVFRNRERGALHAPEFTMVEWYRAGEPYESLMSDCEALLGLTAEAAGQARWSFRGRETDPCRAPQRLTVAEAFLRFADIDVTAGLGEGDGRIRLAEQARERGIRTAADDTWSDVFSRILAERVEPRLGLGRPTILYDYPISEAALARPKPGDPRLAERFELYACGVELANAFGELTDAAEQRRRFEADMAEKQAIYGERYPIDDDFLAALARMPPASGIALGFDRLVMLATGAPRIEQVLWTPVTEPG